MYRKTIFYLFSVRNATIFALSNFLLMTPFVNIGNVPFDIGVLASVFPDNKHITEKARALEKTGVIVRLKKGLYVASPAETGKPLCRELIANHLYGPSYVGKEYALRYWGLIPERVNMITSVTIKHNRNFDNATGCYSYQNCNSDYFPIGVKMCAGDGVNFLMASPEKALCDVINFSNNLNLRYLKDVESYLERDIRFDMDVVPNLDVKIIEACMAVSRKRTSIETLIRYINR